METWKHGTMDKSEHEDIETWRHGQRQGNMEKWRHGGIETWTWRHGNMETWTRRHGLGDLGMEIWTCRHGIVKIIRKTEGQAIFLNPLRVFSSFKRKFVVC
jgi:hypothetical protein